MLTELALPHRVIPGIAEFARGGLPAPAATDDGNEWVDGFCWLYCGQQWTRVLWIGPASVAGAQAPMYACGPCIRTLHEPAGSPSSSTMNRPVPRSRVRPPGMHCHPDGVRAGAPRSKRVPAPPPESPRPVHGSALPFPRGTSPVTRAGFRRGSV